MELALYCPDYGFYEGEKDTIGRRGDFYTSVSVGSLFGELLAFQFADWLEPENERLTTGLGDSSRLLCQLVEAGAHTGQLALDILQFLRQRRPHLFRDLEYWIIEPSARRREWQRKTLEDYANKVHWADSLSQLGGRNGFMPPRIVFANELLDAMPVHRMAWDAGAHSWFEWGVASQGSRFVWSRLPAPTFDVTAINQFCSPDLSSVLPDGFIFEFSPAAEGWWKAAAQIVSSGRLVTLDYGLSAPELLMPERRGGTLRGYRSHAVAADVLADPGEQDITAHVNFSAIQAAGKSAGLTTETFATQEQFLSRIVARIEKSGAAFDEWTPARTRQFQTLVHPAHLGRSFRVLVQRKAA